jgi:hypothetical protein
MAAVVVKATAAVNKRLTNLEYPIVNSIKRGWDEENLHGRRRFAIHLFAGQSGHLTGQAVKLTALSGRGTQGSPPHQRKRLTCTG